MDSGPAGLDQDCFDERPHECAGFRDLAGLQELAHLLGEGGSLVSAVQNLAPFGQDGARLLGRDLQTLLPLAVLGDAVRGVCHRNVAVLDHMPDPTEPAAHVGQLLLDCLQPLPLLTGDSVHLLVKHPYEVADVGFGKDVFPNLADDGLLETPGVEPWCRAGRLPTVQQRLADVVGVFATLGLGGGEGPAAALALEEAAQQVGAGGAAGVNNFRRAGLEELFRVFELLPRHDGREGVGDAHRRSLVLGPPAPNQGSRIGLVGEDLVDGVFRPAAAVSRGNTLVVERPDDVEDALPLEGHVENAAHDAVGGWVEVQSRALLGAILDVDLAVAVGSLAGDPEAA